MGLSVNLLALIGVGLVFVLALGLLLLLGLIAYCAKQAALLPGVPKNDFVPPEKVPGVPHEWLKSTQAELKSLGFRDLTACTKPECNALGMTNYTFLLTSPDGLSMAEVEFVRYPLFMRLLLLLSAPREFKLSLRRVVFTSIFGQKERFITSNIAHIVSAEEQASDNACLAPQSATLKEMYELHCCSMAQFSERSGNQVKRIISPLDYYSFEEARLREIEKHLKEAQISAAASCPSPLLH
jgi:hypothetical protein